MTHAAFREIKQHHIETLNLTVHQFEHRATGASHFHFDSDSDENVFLIALRTMPSDSTGVAHILEHTALCGSERFPVRDPFFLMIRRSLNTFMNAFTGSDYTAYPFASQNRKDFFNLLDIYLDAVFFSRLDPLDFAQEGHRVEFEVPADPGTDLVYRGIVYNEMKGDNSSPISFLHSALHEQLFPTNTYHHNSGGDPRAIPSLSHDDLVSFYRSHYHPSNAILMTFGNIPVLDLQTVFEERALGHFERRQDVIEVALETRYDAPVRSTRPYAVEDTDTQARTHIVMAWLLGETTDLSMLLKCQLLSDVLLDTSASPLRKVLEISDLGSAVSPLSGLEASSREASFMCGLEGSEVEHADALEALVHDTLADVAREGMPIAQLESALHQLELSQREIGGDGSPYGLQLIFSCLPAAIHRGDPLGLLDFDAVLVQLRQEITEPGFLAGLIQDLLLDNQHRVTLVLAPDPQLSAREEAEERARLRGMKDGLDHDQVSRLVARAAELAERQNRSEDLSVLPKVGLKDIGLPREEARATATELAGGRALTRYAVGTNGITYNQIVTRLPDLTMDQCRLLPLYTSILTEIGSATRSYLDTQLAMYASTGGVSAFSAVRTDRDDVNACQGSYTVSSKALAANASSMFQLLKETWQQPNFTERARVRDLIKQIRVRRDASITGNGHLLAMSAASARYRPVSNLSYELTGLGGLLQLRDLDDALGDELELGHFVEGLTTLHDRLMSASSQLLLVTDPATQASATEDVTALWSSPVQSSAEAFTVGPPSVTADLAFTTNTQVSFCAQVFPTVPETHADAPALTVLAGVLKNGYLHPVIREQGGAYGGGAGHDASNGLFRFYSFRDPNLMDTFRAFDRSLEWLSASKLDFSLLEEAILGIVAGLDAPGSPAGEAKQNFHNELSGRGRDIRLRFREGVLATTVADVLRVADTYLAGDSGRAAITSASRQGELDGDFDVISL